jgi:hypothetical protein
MRPQTDLLILLTAVIIINDSKQTLWTQRVSHKLIWEVKLSEGQEGTVLINRTSVLCQALVLPPLGIAQAQEPADGLNLGPLP